MSWPWQSAIAIQGSIKAVVIPSQNFLKDIFLSLREERVDQTKVAEEADLVKIMIWYKL